MLLRSADSVPRTTQNAFGTASELATTTARAIASAVRRLFRSQMDGGASSSKTVFHTAPLLATHDGPVVGIPAITSAFWTMARAIVDIRRTGCAAVSPSSTYSGVAQA